MDNYIYAVGGYDSTCQLRSVERYNIDKKCWEFVSQMNSPRSALNLAVISKKLYALGKYTFLFPAGFKLQILLLAIDADTQTN